MSFYQGKVKNVEILDEEKVKIIFTDFITAGDGEKREEIEGKGAVNLDLSHKLLGLLSDAGIPQHTIERSSENTLIAKNLAMFKIETVVRNIITGSFARRYGFEEGKKLATPVVEFFVKNDELHDPLIDKDVAVNQGYMKSFEAELMQTYALQVNRVLSKVFKEAGMILVDFKLEFGKDKLGNVYIGDELSADSMRVWDIETMEKLDKDRFRKDLGDVLEGYRAILNRINNIEVNIARETLEIIIRIYPKDGVKNPGGQVVQRTLKQLSVPGIVKVNLGKTILIQIENPEDPSWIEKIETACQQILTNPLIENYSLHSYFKG